MTDEPDEQHDNRRTAPDELTTNELIQEDSEWQLVVQLSFDEADELTATIIYAVAEAEGVEPQDIKNPPLYDIVDTDALEAAYTCTRKETPTQNPLCTTGFMYRGFRIVVQSNGWVLVYERLDA